MQASCHGTDNSAFLDALERGKGRAAPDRVLWGTDWPHPNVRQIPDDGDLADRLADFAPDEATLNTILVENPLRLYDFR